MLKLKRVLQFRLNGDSKSEISRKIPIHRNILDKYLALFDKSGKSNEDLLLLSDADLQSIVSPIREEPLQDRLAHLQNLIPDYIRELASTGVTLKMLWTEYLEQKPDGYRYAQFCVHFIEYRKRLSATMHFEHTPGELLEVDFAGSKLSYVDPLTGEVTYCQVLVCTLTFSGYAYVEALKDATQESLFMALSRCLSYMGGTPRNVKSDNMRQFITKNSRYEFSFPALAEQWSLHYNTSLAAARPRKPKDKSTVENGVYQSYLRIFAPLRNQQFLSLEALNEAILKQLERHNNAPFQKKPGSRTELFMLHEKPTLSALPKDSFSIKHTAKAKVQRNYHIILGEDNHQYSVPYVYIGKETQVVYDYNEVEIFIGLQRIALHRRDQMNLGYTTVGEHMPTNHRQQTEARGWDAEFFLRYAESIGSNTIVFFSILMKDRHFVEQTYKACLGVKRLGASYGNERLESACRRAILGRVSYGSLKIILERNLDLQPLPESEELYPEIRHDNIRGPKSFS